MALLVWLPLNGDLRNLGLADILMVSMGTTTYVDGKIGKCIQFNHTLASGIYDANKCAALKFTDNFSYCLWLNNQFDSSDSGAAHYVFTVARADGTTYGYGMLCNGTYASVRFGSLYWNVSIPLNTWNHIALTKSGNIISVYLNGSLYSTNTFTGTLPTYTNYNGLGLGHFRYNGGNIYPSRCLVNDFRIYDHCLSPKEVKEISKGLVLHYKLNEGNYSNSLFPYGVELYDYILSSGTQYIHIPNSSPIVKTEISFALTQRNTNQDTILSLSGNLCYWQLSSGAQRVWNSSGSAGTVVYTVNTRISAVYEITSTSTTIQINGGTVLSTTRYFDTSGIYIFAWKTPNYFASAKLYSCLILENNIITHNLLPCTYFGEPGLWDTVENKFYGNSGSGEFTLGNKIVFYDYINNDGNQDLDTGLIYNSENNNYKIECKFNMSGNVGNYDAVFSAYESENHKTMRIIRMNNDSRFGYYFNTKANSSTAVTTTPNSNIYEVIMTSQLITVHNITLEITEYLTPIYTTATASTTKTFHLFPKSKVNIWYWRIYDGETLLRDMIPCELNGEAGMWDTVTHLFYGNSGTGQFFVRAYHNFDTSGYLNNGSFANNINYLENSPRYDKYAAMNASNYINFTNNFLNLSLPFTICFWCYFANNTSSVIPLTIYDLNHGKFCNFGINSNLVNLFGLFTTTQFLGVLQGTPKIGWAHYALVYDGSTTKMYRDGVLYNLNKTFGYSSTITSSSGYICKTPMSDLRMYTTILSENDIKELYNTSAIVDNLGNTYGYLFEENGEINILSDQNLGIINKLWVSGLSKYTQTNCLCTLTDDGYRIYRPANLTPSDNGNTMWGGFVIDNTNNKFNLEDNHTYIIEFDVKGQSSGLAADIYWTNFVGWGGGGLTPNPTDVVIGNPVKSNFNSTEWQHFFYKFTISDGLYKTCTSAYSSFVAGNTYLSYRGFKFGYNYAATGTLGTDIYIKNLTMHDITNDVDNNINITKAGIVNVSNLLEENSLVQFFHSGTVNSNQLIEI